MAAAGIIKYIGSSRIVSAYNACNSVKIKADTAPNNGDHDQPFERERVGRCWPWPCWKRSPSDSWWTGRWWTKWRILAAILKRPVARRWTWKVPTLEPLRRRTRHLLDNPNIHHHDLTWNWNHLDRWTNHEEQSPGHPLLNERPIDQGVVGFRPSMELRRSPTPKLQLIRQHE